MKKLTHKVVTITIICVFLFLVSLIGKNLYNDFRNNNLDLTKVVSYQANEYGISFQLNNGEEYYLKPMELTTSDQGNTIVENAKETN